ncbi:hypothetical protein HPB52_004497 [Rhipicephalus sanguineus]|uniref:CCHC-type domain-containing protein n=1 Tax=Rhipicephalus sanguineus TaxID=34632 RepID=A0A9D4Q9L8_RHISA|nr:hypothetical protein HPB52_004497 [Rhipicephalus sanguineus]
MASCSSRDFESSSASASDPNEDIDFFLFREQRGGAREIRNQCLAPAGRSPRSRRLRNTQKRRLSQEGTSTMQAENTEDNSKTASHWTFDANSRKTTGKAHIEWLHASRKGRSAKEDAQSAEERAKQPPQPDTTSQPQRHRSTRMRSFPSDDFKIVFRPQAGLDLSKRTLIEVTHAIGRSSGLSQQDFYNNVRVQTQKVENVIIASTASTERASKLQGTTPAEIVAGLRVGSRYSVLGARMLRSSTAAVITFDGQHVPFYVTYMSGDYRCKPYRKSVQYCRTCGAIGHRQDICPQPKANFCYKCGCDKDTEAHDCQPKCKICGEDHETAGKECKKKLRSNPPPHQVRQQQLDNARAREQHWSPSTGDFPGMATTSESSQAPSLHQGPDRSRPHSNQNGRSGSHTRSQSRSAKKVSYARAVTGSNGPRKECQDLQRAIHQRPPAECGTPEIEDRILKQAEARILKRVEERLQAHETKMLDLVERRLLAFEEALTTKLLASVDRTIETVVTKIIEKVDPLTRTITTLDAKLDGFMAQQHNFITYAYKNLVTHEQLAEQSGTKRKERKTEGEESAADFRSRASHERHQAEANGQHGGSQT